MSDTESDSGENGNETTKTFNNPYGQKGLLKCQRCRERRKKCVYQTVDELCQYCLSHNFTDCHKELAAVQKQKAPAGNETATVSGLARKLEASNPHAGYDDILETVRKHGDYVRVHGAVQAVSNPTGNRQTSYKPSAVALQYERMFPSESFEEILERVDKYAK